MSTPISTSLNLERLKRLPVVPVTWQLAFSRLPQWVDQDQGDPFRPFVAMCMASNGGPLGGGNSCAPNDPLVPEALAALDKLALTKGVGYRPQRVQVRDSALAAELEPALEPLGIAIEVVSELPALDEAIADMQRHFASRSPVVAYPASIPDDRLRAFADAAAAFFRAAPWNELTDTDLVVVDSPKAPAGMACFNVMGCAGIEYGLGFYAAPERYAELEAQDFMPRGRFTDDAWLLSFAAISHLPIPDSERFEDLALPLASNEAYPLLIGRAARGGALVADAARLTFAEGLLRALASATPEQLDSGRWSRRVDTFDGPVDYTLALPQLLAAMVADAPVRRSHDTVMRDIQRIVAEQEFESPEAMNAFLQSMVGKVPEHKSSDSPEDRACDLLDRAYESTGRVRIRLAREAAEIWPGCAEAWLIQAQEMPDAARRLGLYRAAVEAGERAIGKKPFNDRVGDFWGILETRPYMRARMGLAQELWQAGEFEQSIAHMLEMLRLNENDNMGVRHEVVPRLIEQGRDDDAARLLESFDMDDGAALSYARALVEFRKGGAGEAANAQLAVAVRANMHVAKYLTGRAKPNVVPGPSFRLGSEEEAVRVLIAQSGAWFATPGAIPWLGANMRPPRSERRAERKKKAARRGR